jgi:hypothetical protein
MRFRLFSVVAVASLMILSLTATNAHAKEQHSKKKMAKNLGYMDDDTSVENEDYDEGEIKAAPTGKKDYKETPDEKAAVRAAQRDLDNTEKLFEKEDCVNPQSKLPKVETARYEEIDGEVSKDKARQEATVKADGEEMKRIEKIVNTEKIIKQVTSVPKSPTKTKAEIEAERALAASEAAALKKVLAHARTVKVEFNDNEAKAVKDRAPASTQGSLADQASPTQAVTRHNDRVNQSLEQDINN